MPKCEDITFYNIFFLIWLHSTRLHNSVKVFTYVSLVLLLQKLGWFEAFRFVTFLVKYFYNSSSKLDCLYLFKFTLFTSAIGLRNSFWRVENVNINVNVNVWPGSKYFRVTNDAYPSSESTSLRRAVYKYQFLFCAEQSSNQKMKPFVSRLFLIKLDTSAADRPHYPSCESTPFALSFPFFDEPAGANVLLNTTIRLQKTTTFSPGSLGNMITFCISTDPAFLLSVHSRFFFSRYISLASAAVLIWSSKSAQSAQSKDVGFLFFPFSSGWLNSCLSNFWMTYNCLSWRSHLSHSSSPNFTKLIFIFFTFL